MQNATRVSDHAITNDAFTLARTHTAQINAATPVSLPSPSRIETGYRPCDTPQEKESPGVPLSPKGPGTGQELRETLSQPTRSLRAYRCDQDLYVVIIRCRTGLSSNRPPVLMPIISSSIHIYLSYLHQLCPSMWTSPRH